MATKIQIRRGTPPVPALSEGELGLEITNKKVYIGTGTTVDDNLELLTENSSNATLDDFNTLNTYADKLVHLENINSDLNTLIGGKASTTHTHGNIQNDGTITGASTIATGDRLLISDNGTVAQTSIQFGTGGGFLKEDGTWANPNTDTDTTYTISSQSTTGGREIRLTGSDASTDGVDILAGQNIAVTGNTDAISISTTDEIFIPKTGDNSGSNSIVFQGNAVGSDFQRNLNINNAGDLYYNNTKVVLEDKDITLTLDGDVTGTATFTNLGNATLTTTIADDSHNHTIANIDGLQTSLNNKANIDSPAFEGTPTALTPPVGDDSTRLATTEFVTNAAVGGVVLDNRVEWNFVGYSLDPFDGDPIEVSSNDLGESFDWINYDYKFVFNGETNAEDTTALRITFDNNTSAYKYSWLYQKTTLTGTSTVVETNSGDNGTGINANYIYTGLGINSSSSGGQLTGVNCEVIVSRTVIIPSAGLPGWSISGTGYGHYFPSTQALSTASDGIVQSKFTASYRQDLEISSIQFHHGLTAGDPDPGNLGDGPNNLHNIVRVYKRKRIFS